MPLPISIFHNSSPNNRNEDQIEKSTIVLRKDLLENLVGYSPHKNLEWKHNESEYVTLPETNIAHENPHLSW